MISRFFAFVPGVKHLVALRAACLAISSLANIGFVYVCVGILSPILIPAKYTGKSLLSSVELTSYLISLVGILIIKYIAFHQSCIFSTEIGTRVAMKLRPKMLRSMISLSSANRNDSVEYSSICVNEDIAWVQRWAGLLLPQIFAAFPMPFAVSIALFSINTYLASICLVAAVFSALALCTALYNIRVLLRCLCAFLTYFMVAVAVVCTVWLLSVRSVGLPAAMLTLPLLMLSVDPIRRVANCMHIKNRAVLGLNNIGDLFKSVAANGGSSNNSSTLDSEYSQSVLEKIDNKSSLSIPDGASNVSLHVRCNFVKNNRPLRASFNVSSGKLNVMPSEYYDLVANNVLNGVTFSSKSNVALSYSDSYALPDLGADSPFVASDFGDIVGNPSYITLNNVDPGALADLVTIVRKNSHMFSATLRENLLMASKNATTTSMWQALGAARADGVVYADYNGLDLRVENIHAENKQDILRRLVMARALIRRTPVYIFDYSSKNISAKEAKNLCDILRKIAKKATILVFLPSDSYATSADNLVKVSVFSDSRARAASVGTLSGDSNGDLRAQSGDSNGDLSGDERENERENIAHNSGKKSKVSYLKKALFAILSAFSTVINIVCALLIPVCAIAAMFAIASRPLFGLGVKDYVLVVVVCACLRCLTLVASFAGLDLHHAHLHKAGLSMSVGMILSIIPAIVLLSYFSVQIAIFASVICLLIVFVIPGLFSLSLKSFINKVHLDQKMVELEVDDVELGLQEVLAFRQGDYCVKRVVDSMRKLAQQRVRLSRKVGRMQAILMSVSLIGIANAIMLVSSTIHPLVTKNPQWNVVHAVMAIIILISLIQQVLNIVIRRIPWVVDINHAAQS
ncbi:ABC transporter ATP-binding protein [Gardnerella piotii]|uniref:ABC transporter ATP-binding protein n=1 Tax=Gardnerella piotii TaxID=2792977 RepID=A0ABU5MPT2_9BIFI|nr:ABC transporter ATP-binding protein [Gardnerella piotii]MDZ7544416.1 ABC transporter ATP-binding protein [Gardnerella piotii]MDZ7552218.1 ABC transporter ATP-binding protein [Gardnerella piotii]